MYTPQFSIQASVSVRRLAWALGLPMTKTVDIIISEISSVFSSSTICPKCKDKTKCHLCIFRLPTAAENTALAC